MTLTRPLPDDFGNQGTTDLTVVLDQYATAIEAVQASDANKAALTHASLHAPGGADPLSTAAPGASAVADSAAAGSATTLARSDHRHSREAFGTPTVAAGLGKSNAAGTATTVAHSDHDHATSSAATIQAALANVSISAAGLAPTAPNDATKYLDGTGAYSVPAGGGGGVRVEAQTLEWGGVVMTNVGASRLYMTRSGTLESVVTGVSTAPTGASLICDFNKNGTTVFGTQANRPTIAAGGFTSGAVLAASMSVTTFAAGDYFTFDIDQVGSTIQGSDLTFTVRMLT
jgi:hypothetical protein